MFNPFHINKERNDMARWSCYIVLIVTSVLAYKLQLAQAIDVNNNQTKSQKLYC